MLAVVDQRLETLLPPRHLRLCRRRFLVFRDAVRGSVPVLARVIQDVHSGFTVSAGAAGFLIEALEALGQLPVDDEADVFLVDAHSERGGGDDDVVARLIGQPFALAVCAVETAEPGVIGCCADVVAAEA